MCEISIEIQKHALCSLMFLHIHQATKEYFSVSKRSEIEHELWHRLVMSYCSTGQPSENIIYSLRALLSFPFPGLS